MPRTLMLDIDGALVDSNDADARAWVKALASQGVQVSFETVRLLIGMGGDQLLPAATGMQEGDPRFKPATEAWKREMSAELPGLQAFSGARGLVEAAQRAGWSPPAAIRAG